jgi:riboflavin biosynthesis pyrimidine reductase
VRRFPTAGIIRTVDEPTIDDPTDDPGAPAIRRLLPSLGDVRSMRDAYDLDRPDPGHRPWVSLCMVASVDGSIALDGASGGLGNANDRAVLLGLRALADLVLVGAGTVRGEGYGRPGRRDLRIGVVTNSGSLDLDAELFRSGAGFLVAPRSAPIDEDRVDVLRAGDEAVDLADAIARLHEIRPGVRHVQVEGGPSLNAALLDADLLDELAVTVSPQLVGGDGPRLTSGADESSRHYRLDQLLVDVEGYLFGRWLRHR